MEIVDVTDEGLPGRWWVAHRLIGEGDVGIGVFHGDWEHLEGTGCDQLPEAFRAWLTDDPKLLVGFELRRKNEGPIRVNIRAIVLPLPTQLPSDITEIVQLAGGLVMPDALRGPMDCAIVLVLHDRQYERWEIRGDTPCTMENLIRAISAYSKGKAIALVNPGVVQIEHPEGIQDRRAVMVTTEFEGHRLLLAQTLKIDEKPSGLEIHLAEGFLQDGGDPGAEGWIGVPPTQEVRIEFPVLGSVPGGTVAEG
jgi:hypothetical protein